MRETLSTIQGKINANAMRQYKLQKELKKLYIQRKSLKNYKG